MLHVEAAYWGSRFAYKQPNQSNLVRSHLVPPRRGIKQLGLRCLFILFTCGDSVSRYWRWNRRLTICLASLYYIESPLQYADCLHMKLSPICIVEGVLFYNNQQRNPILSISREAWECESWSIWIQRKGLFVFCSFSMKVVRRVRESKFNPI